MGRGTAARAAATVITTRILCSYCIPLANSFIANRPVVVHAINESQTTGFRPVEYPSSYEVWDYYRFQNDYGGYVKKKRKHDMIAELKTKSTDADGERDPAPQPYCFRKSDFFPEMEYPLSARDMWLPAYWNRHLGTAEAFDTDTIKHKTNENNNHVTTTLNYITNKDPENSKMGPDTACNNNENQGEIMRGNDTSSGSTATEIISSTETTESLPMLLPRTTISEAHGSTNLYDQSYPTTVPMTPNEDSQRNIEEIIVDITYSNVTSCSPLECLTPKVPSSYDETEENVLLSTAYTSTDEVKSTTSAPSSSASSSTDEMSRIWSNTECDPSAISGRMTSPSSCPDSISENWIFNSNDSYISWGTFPEYCDEFMILVDNNIFTDSIVNCSILNLTFDPDISSECNKPASDNSNGSLCRYFDNINNFIEVDKAKSVLNSSIVSDNEKKSLSGVKDSDQLKEFEEVIPTLEFSDGKSEFCTESPYDC